MKINKIALTLLVVCPPCLAQQFTPAEQKLTEYRLAVDVAAKTEKMVNMRLPGEASQSAIKACVDAWAPFQNDPRSTYVVGAYLRIKVNGEVKPPKSFKQIVIDARSKNRLGGQTPTVLLCEFKTPFVVDSQSAELWTMIKRDEGEEAFVEKFITKNTLHRE